MNMARPPTAEGALADKSHSPPGPTGGGDVPGEPPIGPSGGGGLTRMTVNLNRQAVQALDVLTDETGLSKTDAVNRALQIYRIVHQMVQGDGGALTVMHSDGSMERVYFV